MQSVHNVHKGVNGRDDSSNQEYFEEDIKTESKHVDVVRTKVETKEDVKPDSQEYFEKDMKTE